MADNPPNLWKQFVDRAYQIIGTYRDSDGRIRVSPYRQKGIRISYDNSNSRFNDYSFACSAESIWSNARENLTEEQWRIEQEIKEAWKDYKEKKRQLRCDRWKDSYWAMPEKDEK